MTTTILTLARDGSSITLRLEPDLAGDRRALAHGAGHGLSHAGALDGSLRDVVLEAAERFAGGPPASTDAAIAQLRAAVAAVAPDASLAVVAVGAEGGLPRWPSSLRTGAPALDAGGIWPFDAELAGLRIGARQIVKRECFSDAAADADRAWLEANGVTVRGPAEPDADGRRVLFGAIDAAALDGDLDDVEGALRARRDPVAIRRLGAVLGYPACCIGAFVDAGAQDDLSLVAALLPAIGHPPAPHHTQWLNQPLAIISHVPCTLDCAPSIALATALVDELERAHPGFAAAWTALARRVHAVTRDGRNLALIGDGTPGADFAIEAAVELHMPSAPDLSDLLSTADDVATRRLSDIDAVAVADHRL